MKSGDKYGFTLIELMVVLALLALLTLLTVPMIIKIYEEAKKKTFRFEIESYVKIGEEGYAAILLSNELPVETLYKYENGVETKEGNININFKGNKPKDGTIKILPDGNLELKIYDGTHCAVKSSSDDLKIEKKSYEECLGEETQTPSMITKTYLMNNGADDGWVEFAGYEDFLSDNNYIWVGYIASYRNLWVKWNNIDIPKNSVVTSAKIKYKFISGIPLAENALTLIYFNNVGNAVAPTSYSDFESKTLTNNNVSWNIPDYDTDIWLESPDISAIVQEIINRSDWSLGNSMMLIHRRHPENNTGSQSRSFNSYESGVENAPKLEITYTAQ